MVLPDDFEIQWEGMTLSIHVHSVRDRKVFEVTFPDGRSNLFMARSEVAAGKKMWMSIPEGRQPEAIPIGGIIVGHFLQQQTQE